MTSVRALLIIGVLAAQVASARAEGAEGAERRLIVREPVRREAPGGVSPILYLERCKGGCIIHQGANDARTNTSKIPKIAEARVGEFANLANQTGARADAEWNQIVACVKEVYSPYAVTVTDVKPPSTSSYHAAVVAGKPGDVGFANDILGVAPLASDCSAIDNVMSFTFANQHPAVGRVLNVCWTAAQESAHAFGLDHEYAFSNNRSACTDPMTYRNDCGGQKFFRNEPATCGETAARDCACGGKQNSHQKLLAVFGAGTPTTKPPTITLMAPRNGGMLGTDPVTATAGAQRGVARVEAWFNGFPWAAVPGAKFLLNGQPDPFTYEIAIPAALPDSIVDVKAVAYDDLGAATSSATVTVTKGSPCTTDERCATGQHCDAGRCQWPDPVGELGDACEYPQFCTSLRCDGTPGAQTCSLDCVVGASACPDGYACFARTTGSDDGACLPDDRAGCCRADRGGAGWLSAGALAAVVAAIGSRRSRRDRQRR